MLTIKQLREIKKFSQTDFAKKMGVSLRTVQNWEANQEKIPMDKLGKIYKELEGDVPKIQYNINEKLHILHEPQDSYGLKKENQDLKRIILAKDKQLSIYEKLIENLEEKVQHFEEVLGQKKQNGTS